MSIDYRKAPTGNERAAFQAYYASLAPGEHVEGAVVFYAGMRAERATRRQVTNLPALVPEVPVDEQAARELLFWFTRTLAETPAGPELTQAVELGLKRIINLDRIVNG